VIAPTEVVVDIHIDVGRLGLIEPELIDTVVNGLRSVMRYLKMIDGSLAPARQPRFITTRDNRTSEHDGILYTLVAAGAYVTAGQRLAYITDFHGRILQEVTAPQAGAVLVIVKTPAIKKGERVAVIAIASPH
jgi:predicted deacylase